MKKFYSGIRFHFLLLSLVYCLAPFFTQAQSMAISEGLSIRNDYGYELVGRLRDRILLFRDKYDEFEVQAFDNQMRLSWSKEIDDLGRHGVQILAVVGGKNDFSIIYKLRKKGYTTLRVHKYDPGANLIDSMMVKDYGERLFVPPVLELVRSEDKNCFAVYNTSEHSKLEVTCLKLDKMQLLWDKKVDLEENFYDTKVGDMALSNEGEFFLGTEYNNRRSRIEDHEYRILGINAGTDQPIRIPLHEFLTTSSALTYDNKNHRLVAAGLYADKNRDRANGAFFVAITPGQPSFAFYSEPFDDKFISILRKRDVEEDNKGITDAELRQLILRQDGGVLLVAERSHEIQRGSAAGRGFWREGMRMVVDFYFDDVFVIALHPDGKLHWNTVLHKKQYSQDDDGTFSSFFMVRNADKLHLLFNDEIKYENTCSEYVVSPLGEFDRNSLLNTVNQNLRLRFRDALQISAGECLVPSEFRNKLKLVLLRF